MKFKDLSIGDRFKLPDSEIVYEKIEYEYYGCCNDDYNSIDTTTGQKLFTFNKQEIIRWTDTST